MNVFVADEDVNVGEALHLLQSPYGVPCRRIQPRPSSSPSSPLSRGQPLIQHTWTHLRTTNIVESPFNQVRLRTNASRRFNKTENAEARIWSVLCVSLRCHGEHLAPHT